MQTRTARLFASLASVGMVAGLALAGPGEASAADAVQGPKLTASVSGNVVTLSIDDPNTPPSATCVSALLDAGQAIEAGIAFASKDYVKLAALIAGGGAKAGPATALGIAGPDLKYTVPDGVYAYAGSCTGIPEPGFSVEPVLVGTPGTGSLS